LLKKHIEIVHSEERRFSCKVCLKQYKTQNALDVHIKLTHEIDVLIGCSQCGREFKTPATLKRHELLVHLKTKAFKCDICDNLFAARANLNYHRINVHGIGEKKMIGCPRCGVQLSTRNTLRRHLKARRGCNPVLLVTAIKTELKQVDILDESLNLTTETINQVESKQVEVLDESLLEGLKERSLSLTNLKEASKLSCKKLKNSNKNNHQRKKRGLEGSSSNHSSKKIKLDDENSESLKRRNTLLLQQRIMTFSYAKFAIDFSRQNLDLIVTWRFTLITFWLEIL
jgi:hypothetical protein